jgi:hypothetical protein
MKKYIAEKAIIIGKSNFQTTEQLAKFVKASGEENICPHIPYMKCIELNTDIQPLESTTGTIQWINENGYFVCENGYEYNIESFL